jgi:hypothetical protein
MPSFEFADCPTKLNLTVAADTQEQTGSVSCTIRNTTTRRQTARIRIEPQGTAKPEWFMLAGAPATSPLEIEQDIDAGGTLTAQVSAKVPPKTQAGSQTFRLRVTSETLPDTDFAEGPAIALDIAAWKEPEVKKAGLPWWAIAAAAVFVLIVGGAIGYLVWPRGLDPTLVNGKPFAEAVTIVASKGYPGIKAQPGDPAGNNPAKQIVVGVGKDANGAVALLVDPGVAVPAMVGKSIEEAIAAFLNKGIVPDVSYSRLAGTADGIVTDTSPKPGVPVALGATAGLVVNDQPDGPPRPPSFCRRFPRLCADRRSRVVFDRAELPKSILDILARHRPLQP